jgi:hypothetical protein
MFHCVKSLFKIKLYNDNLPLGLMADVKKLESTGNTVLN